MSYLPLRTYLLSLLIIGGIFSLKGQEKEQEAPEEPPISRYKGFKLEFAIPYNRFAIYGREGWGVGVGLLAPQYYIRNNISIGLQLEMDIGSLYDHLFPFLTFMATYDYYFTNEENRPSLGVGMGVGNGGLVVSPRFKYHLDWFIFHSSYDINTHIPNGFRVGMAFTLFGKAKEKKQPKTPEEQTKAPEEEAKAPEEEAIKRYKGFKLELSGLFSRLAFYGEKESVFGLILLAPQYYIHNNISVGVQYENHPSLSNIFSATGDYYFGNGARRPALGLGVGLNVHQRTILFTGDKTETFVALVLSPRFKYHLGWFNLNLNYDINIHRQVPHSLQFGIGFTLYGKKK